IEPRLDAPVAVLPARAVIKSAATPKGAHSFVARVINSTSKLLRAVDYFFAGSLILSPEPLVSTSVPASESHRARLRKARPRWLTNHFSSCDSSAKVLSIGG